MGGERGYLRASAGDAMGSDERTYEGPMRPAAHCKRELMVVERG